MPDPSRLVSAPSDPRGRLVAIFVGAVLLPSLALSVVLFYLIPRHAEATEIALFKRAEKILYHVEGELEVLARSRALDAARAVGVERLLDGRAEVVRPALAAADFDPNMFESLHVEGSSPRGRTRRKLTARADELEGLRELFVDLGPDPAREEDRVDLPPGEFGVEATLRFRYSCAYAHGTLLHEYFEREFGSPESSLVVRVTEGDERVVYESAATPEGRRFEVYRLMTSPAFRGLTLHLRYKERSIAEDVRRWKLGTFTLIGFIDLMLAAGLFLVYSNVRRELHLSRLKSDFVANVTHELKTPLALIRLFAETLELGRVSSEEKNRQYLRVINKESLRLTQLINNILDFSRIEAGRKEYKFVAADVAVVVDEVLDAYRFQIEQQGFALEQEIARELPEVEVDKEALAQAVLNLINNAIKYSRDEKWIRVSVAREGEKLLITVADHGIGIPKPEQRKIFDKFYRAENSLVHETKGSGLGLALVRHIMEAHGGEVLVDSAPGRGSTFTLVLPFARPGARRASA